MIDTAVLDGEYYFEVIESVENKIIELDKNIERAKKLRVSYNQFETQRNRIVEQKNNLAKIIEHFQNVSIADISNDKFQPGMDKVIQALNSN